MLKDLRKGTEYAGPIDSESQMPSGYGSLTLANGDKYAGDFDKGKMHGTGVRRYRNGDKFTGKFALGMPSEGEMIYNEIEERYVGEMLNGIQ